MISSEYTHYISYQVVTINKSQAIDKTPIGCISHLHTDGLSSADKFNKKTGPKVANKL